MVASSTISDRNEILWKWKRKYVQFSESILHGCIVLVTNINVAQKYIYAIPSSFIESTKLGPTKNVKSSKFEFGDT